MNAHNSTSTSEEQRLETKKRREENNKLVKLYRLLKYAKFECGNECHVRMTKTAFENQLCIATNLHTVENEEHRTHAYECARALFHSPHIEAHLHGTATVTNNPFIYYHNI